MTAILNRLNVVMRMMALAIVVAGAMGAASPASAQGGVVVRGNQRIEAETVRSYLTFKSSQGYDAAKADESLKALFATGLFSDVRITRDGGSVVVTVVENPVINRVAFEGNKKVEKDVLQKEVESNTRRVYTRATVQADVQRIIDVYRRQGRFDVRVEPKIIELPQGRVDLVFEINEGDKTKISSISFVGNKAYSARRLREVVTTSESNWLSWLKNSDVYDPDRLAVDQELLRRFYLKNGYADFRVISAVADYDRDKNAFFITVTVEEGEQYRFGDVDVESSVRNIDAASLKSNIKSSSGSVFNAELIDKSLEEISNAVSRTGYAFASVRPRAERDPANRVVHVTYVVEEGARIYVERINIRGNTRTMDQVIRREFDIAEGDAFNRVLVDRAERRLNQLNFFKKVSITREPGSSPDRVVLNVNVEEQSTGEVSFGVGYATNDGIIADVSIAERNFLGRGQYVKAGVGWGEKRRSFDFSFTEPYFLDRRLSAGFDVFYRRTQASTTASFDQEMLGAGVRAGTMLNDDLSMQVRYRGYQQKISIGNAYWDCNSGIPNTNLTTTPNSDGDYLKGSPACVDNGEASMALKAGAGTSFVSMVGTTFVYNKLDNTKNPRNGYYGEISFDFAGVGGDAKFFRTMAEGRGYYNFVGDLVGMVKVTGGNMFGWGGEGVRIVDSFFKGGEFIRGFAPGGIGPRDISALNASRLDSLGGTSYMGVTTELQFPFPGAPEELGLKTAVFMDAGTLFGVGNMPTTAGMTPCPGSTPVGGGGGSCYVDEQWSLRASAGVSLIWQSPMGPLRFDFGFPLVKRPYDQTQMFRFSGGTSF